MSVQPQSIYDKLRPHLDSLDLIRRLNLDMVRSIGSEAYCKPLCHESTSGESLHVNIHSGRWMCRACQSSGVYGDLFQLVEYVLTNGQPPSRGSEQGQSEGHRIALTWLCDQFAIPFEAERVVEDPGLDALHLFAMASHQHLLKSPQVLAWIQEKWGFDRATVEAYGIGFMPSPILANLLTEAMRSTSRHAFRTSGLGWYTQDGKWHTHFEGRVLFPYLESGRAVYLIGRSTPWTPKPEEGRHRPKYHKLSVHSDQRKFISKRITNDHLYNEPAMRGAEEIGVLEGVTDAVAIAALGVAVVSPVTISFNATDLKRFIRKCHDNEIKRVWILFDNELSGSGNWAARLTGMKLVDGGLSVKILTLPLGPTQQAALEEVIKVLGQDAFRQLESCDPRQRKELVTRLVPNEAQRAWLIDQIRATKIDAAEWCAAQGPAAPHAFDQLRKKGQDVIKLEVEEIAEGIDHSQPSDVRAASFDSIIDLAAHIEDRLTRGDYAGMIAKAAGKGVPKVEVARRIAAARKDIVKPKRAEEKEEAAAMEAGAAPDLSSLVLLPPEMSHTQPVAPPPLPPDPSKPAAPKAPAAPKPKVKTDHERYSTARASVQAGVKQKWPAEALGDYVAQTIMRSMGWTPFQTQTDLYLVRGNQRVLVESKPFAALLFLAAGLTKVKGTHREYIASAIYFIGKGARRVDDVSWSHVDENETVYFPTGDTVGRIVAISSGVVQQARMAEVRVPAVAGASFKPFTYVEDGGGIDAALELFGWTSLSPGDRLILIYWLVCLPILRRIGTIPIVRIEGGSASGKTRTVDAVSYLVNGRKTASVPTGPALASSMSAQMLTIDDNRESHDVTRSMLATLLQATQLGALEKRRANTDTGTVTERICGAILMNGIEPIHDGRSEIASRTLTLRCDEAYRAADSPRENNVLYDALKGCRDLFWSDACRACSAALKYDEVYGPSLGEQIERIFGETRIGRLSVYLRLMYLTWVAGLPEERRENPLHTIDGLWRDAFERIGEYALKSLIDEELSVMVLNYVFAYGRMICEPKHTGSDEHVALGGKFILDAPKGDAYLGPMRASVLAKRARHAAKELNAPSAVRESLRAGQLGARLIDGVGFMRAAGYHVEIETTNKGIERFSFFQPGTPKPAAEPPMGGWGGDTWQMP